MIGLQIENFVLIVSIQRHQSTIRFIMKKLSLVFLGVISILEILVLGIIFLIQIWVDTNSHKSTIKR